MRTLQFAILIAAWTALGAAACHRVAGGSEDGGGADGDTDADTDADADTDTDADADVDTDIGTESCDEIQPYCCTDACPCVEPDDRCIVTWDGIDPDALGVCKPQTSGADCWVYEDCAEGEFCAGGYVCPCEMDCDWEGTGICSPVSGPCCEGAPDMCPDDYLCLALDGTDTCHGILSAPHCWTNDDCYGPIGTSCVGATLCACDEDCLSEPGTCTWDEKHGG
jgi:hypothetical protein